ncbi:MAG: NAD-dependent epimerase/dehydratase family protein, partial [Thermoleophilia bacterium]|nr:NAD-dependent epimerase/dehydratase family protein [Thermoleophilia bacterium]
MARVLVIGGNGFIGSHVVDGLVGAGHDVTVFDRFSTGHRLFDSTSVSQVVGDFLNRHDVAKAVAGHDVVLHFLSATTPMTAHHDPSLDITTNVAPTVELLRVCVAAGVERVIFASTGGAIYGPQGKSEYTEDDHALPVSPYGIGKLAIERYLAYFSATEGLRSVSLRISNPYGPRQHLNRKQGLIPIALRQIFQGLPVRRFGDGSMVRDYVFVQDLVAMILPFVVEPPRHSLYNLG